MAKRRSGVVSTRARVKLRRLLQHTETDMRPTMERIGEMVLSDQKEKVPKLTGALADALGMFVRKDGLRLEVGLRGKKKQKEFFYARFLEFGTKGGEAKLHEKLGKKVLSDGKEVFGRSADIPPRPAKPFIRPSYDANKDKIRAMINKMTDQALKKAQQ